MKPKWDNDMEVDLIDMVKKDRSIWDITHPNFNKKRMRRESFLIIRDHIKKKWYGKGASKITTNDIIHKYNSLKGYFNKIHKNKVKGLQLSWTHYERLSFLLSQLISESTVENYSSNNLQPVSELSKEKDNKNKSGTPKNKSVKNVNSNVLATTDSSITASITTKNITTEASKSNITTSVNNSAIISYLPSTFNNSIIPNTFISPNNFFIQTPGNYIPQSSISSFKPMTSNFILVTSSVNAPSVISPSPVISANDTLSDNTELKEKVLNFQTENKLEISECIITPQNLCYPSLHTPSNSKLVHNSNKNESDEIIFLKQIKHEPVSTAAEEFDPFMSYTSNASVKKINPVICDIPSTTAMEVDPVISNVSSILDTELDPVISNVSSPPAIFNQLVDSVLSIISNETTEEDDLETSNISDSSIREVCPVISNVSNVVVPEVDSNSVIKDVKPTMSNIPNTKVTPAISNISNRAVKEGAPIISTITKEATDEIDRDEAFCHYILTTLKGLPKSRLKKKLKMDIMCLLSNAEYGEDSC